VKVARAKLLGQGTQGSYSLGFQQPVRYQVGDHQAVGKLIVAEGLGQLARVDGEPA